MFAKKAGRAALGGRYAVVTSASLDGKRDQNSLILLRKGYFDPASVKEHTAQARLPPKRPMPSAQVMCAKPTPWLAARERTERARQPPDRARRPTAPVRPAGDGHFPALDPRGQRRSPCGLSRRRLRAALPARFLPRRYQRSCDAACAQRRARARDAPLCTRPQRSAPTRPRRRISRRAALRSPAGTPGRQPPQPPPRARCAASGWRARCLRTD